MFLHSRRFISVERFLLSSCAPSWLDIPIQIGCIFFLMFTSRAMCCLFDIHMYKRAGEADLCTFSFFFTILGCVGGGGFQDPAGNVRDSSSCQGLV